MDIHRVLSELRVFRIEVIYAVVLAAVTLPFRDGWMGFVIMLAASAGVWWMGFRHRNLAHHQRVREIWETTRRIEDRGLGAAGPQDTAGPLAPVLTLHRG